jgi:PPOX class probable F420-dependent enzyme
VSYDPTRLPAAAVPFLTERHLATLTTLRADGTPHVVPVGFTWQADRTLARVITSGGSLKARNAALTGARAALCQLEGRYWLTLEGAVRVLTDPAEVLDAEQRYAERYRPPRVNPQRVVLEIAVDKILGSLPDSPLPDSSGPAGSS